MDEFINKNEKKTMNVYTTPAGEYTTPTGEYATPTGEYVTPTGEYETTPGEITKQPEEQSEDSQMMQDFIMVEKQENVRNSGFVSLTTGSVKSSDAYSEEGKEMVKKISFFSPFYLSKKELTTRTEEDKKTANKEKADIGRMSFEELTSWALAHAKVEGANSLFVRMVEEMVTIGRMKDKWKDVKGTVDSSDFCDEYYSKIEDLRGLAENYYDDHNKLIVFTKKGRLRLEMARVMKDRTAQGICEGLKNEMREIIRNEFFEDYTDLAKERYRLTLRAGENSNVLTNATKKLFKDAVQTRVPLSRLFNVTHRTKTPAENERGRIQNIKVMTALKKYTEEGNDEDLVKIYDGIVDEALKFDITSTMYNPNYAILNPQKFDSLTRLCDFYMDFIDNATDDGLALFEKLPKTKYEVYLSKMNVLKDLLDAMQGRLRCTYGFQPDHIAEYNLDSVQRERKLSDINTAQEEMDALEREESVQKKRVLHEEILHDEQDEEDIEASYERLYEGQRKYYVDVYSAALMHRAQYLENVKAKSDKYSAVVNDTKIASNITNKRGAFSFLYRGNPFMPGAEEEWNGRVVTAVEELKEEKNSLLEEVMNDMFDEIINFEVTEDILEESFIMAHPEYLVNINRYSQLVADITESNYGPLVTSAMDKIQAQRKKTGEWAKITDKTDFFIEYGFRYCKPVAEAYGVSTLLIASSSKITDEDKELSLKGGTSDSSFFSSSEYLEKKEELRAWIRRL